MKIIWLAGLLFREQKTEIIWEILETQLTYLQFRIAMWHLFQHWKLLLCTFVELLYNFVSMETPDMHICRNGIIYHNECNLFNYKVDRSNVWIEKEIARYSFLFHCDHHCKETWCATSYVNRFFQHML